MSDEVADFHVKRRQKKRQKLRNTRNDLYTKNSPHSLDPRSTMSASENEIFRSQKRCFEEMTEIDKVSVTVKTG